MLFRSTELLACKTLVYVVPETLAVLVFTSVLACSVLVYVGPDTDKTTALANTVSNCVV